MTKYRLAILTSHPIQYQTPLFQKLANHPRIELVIYFCWDFGVGRKTYDVEFGEKISWDIPLLEGYKYRLLKNYSPKPSSNFWGQINPGIIREFKKNNYEAVIIFGWNSFTNWLAFIAAIFLGIPIFLRGENPLNQELAKARWKLRLKKILFKKFLFPRISTFLYIGEENRKFYKYYGVPDSKLFFAPYAVDNERFKKAYQELRSKKYELRKSLEIDRNDIVILFVGKLIEKKKPFDLLYSYQQLTTDSQQLKEKAHLLYVGDGILKEKLENYVKEHNLKNVHFAGFKNQTELPKYYALADIFVLPSGMGETWGLAVNEAMCFGLPVMVSNLVGCAPDLVRHGENGFIFPMGDIDKLTRHLEELINSKAKRKLFGERCFKIVQGYSYGQDIDGILRASETLRS